jgi:WD40 repeat protein
MIAAGGYPKSVRLFDLKGREFPLSLPSDLCPQMAFIPGTQFLAATNVLFDNLCFWDVKSGKSYPLEQPRVKNRVQFITASPDGKYFALGDGDRVHLYDVDKRSILAQFGGVVDVYVVAFSPDSKLVAAGGGGTDRNDIHIWDVQRKTETILLRGNEWGVLSLAFAPDGKTLATVQARNPIRFWDLAKQQEVAQIDRQASTLAYSPDGKWLASGEDGIISVWDPDSREEIRKISLKSRWVRCLAFSPDGKTLAAGTDAHSLYLFDVSTGKEIFPRSGHEHSVLSVAFAPDGKTLASRGGDNSVRLWDVKTRQERHHFSIDQGGRYTGVSQFVSPERSVAFSPDGSRVAAAGGLEKLGRWLGRSTYLWDAASGKLLQEFQEPKEVKTVPFAVAFTPDTGELAVSNLVSIRLYSPSSYEEKGQIPAPLIGAFAFSPNGRLIAGGKTKSEGGGFMMIDRRSGRALHTIPAKHSTGVRVVEFSPSGHLLATCLENSGGTPACDLRLWETTTGTLVRTITLKDEDINSVAFSLDGRVLAAALNKDWTVRLFDVFTGKELAKLEGHRGPVRTVAFSPDGKTVASGSDDTTVLLWDVSSFRPKPPVGDGDREKLIRLRDQLQGLKNPAAAYDAVLTLSEVGEKAVAFLAESLKPIPTPDPKRLRKWLRDLDAEEFEVRQEAEAELAKLGLLAERALLEAQKEPPSKQVAVTLKMLLEKISSAGVSEEEVRESRALLVLELIGSESAGDLLRKLAGGAEGARLTQDAQLALKRLERLDQLAKDH